MYIYISKIIFRSWIDCSKWDLCAYCWQLCAVQLRAKQSHVNISYDNVMLGNVIIGIMPKHAVP
jgi:hypothetical protein